MNVLGVRCSNKDCSFVVISGDQKKPSIIEKGEFQFPKSFSRAQEMKWFLQEIEGILEKFNVTIISIKASEGLAIRDKSFVMRTENEAMVYLASANKGIRFVFKKVNSTIAKDLGLKGKAKYLETKLDRSAILGFDNFSKKLQEAILVSWSCLK